ncbi:MAG: hypothetical protein R3D58_07195 [Saprospiraceae bacterium]
MTENNFYNVLKEKLAAFRPSLRHYEEDWLSLSDRLDLALPQVFRDRRQVVLPLLLMFVALLLSNLLWWKESRENRIAIQSLSMQLSGLQTSITSLNNPAPVTLKDTVWQTVYLKATDQKPFDKRTTGQRIVDSGRNSLLKWEPGVGNNLLNRSTTEPNAFEQQQTGRDIDADKNESIIQDRVADNVEYSNAGLGHVAGTMYHLSPLDIPIIPFLKTSTKRAEFTPDMVLTLAPKRNPRPLGPLLLKALKPEYIKAGLVTAWLYPVSPDLIHQSGFLIGVQSGIGFRRHWSLTLEYTYSQLHYESSDPAAILGAPDYPVVLSPDEHFTHLDLRRQAIRQFGIGLRYSFSQLGKIRPYAGLNWGNQTLMPYSVAYEVELEPSNTLEQGTFAVDKTTRLQNIMRIGTGLEVPVSRHMDFTVEAFYAHQWSKKNRGAPGMTGIRAGMNWMF